MLKKTFSAQKLKQILIPIIIAMFLSACTTNLFNNTSDNLLRSDANANSEFYLNQVHKSQDLELQNTYQLLAARALLSENKLLQAQGILSSLGKLTDEQNLDKSLLLAQLAALQNRNQAATQILQGITLEKLSPSQQVRYYAIEARLAENNGDFMSAVRSRIKMNTLITDYQRKQENVNTIWQTLRQQDANVLRFAQVQPNETALIGWLDLIDTYNTYLSQPDQLLAAIQRWKAKYPSHNANLFMPSELKNIINYQKTNITNIALLLPLSGNAKLIGDTIKAGFDEARGSNNPIIVETYDTMTTPVPQLIEQARAAGAQAIVGPLLKNNVDAVLNSNTTGLDILALNSTPDSVARPNICYFGLSPEAEARDGANHMWQSNIRNPLLIVPQNDLGQRSASAFNLRWQQLSGTDATTQYYNKPEDIINALQSGLANINNSGINGKIGIYIIADNLDLLDIKNELSNSSFAGKFQIFASSRSNSPNNGPDFRLTMDGVSFSEIPFLEQMDSDLYKKVSQVTNGDYSLMRLYALGADSWNLITHFNELRQIPDYNLQGLTGDLSAGSDCNLNRKLVWLTYSNGTIVAGQ